jgi:hypothetical protein
MTMKDKIVSDRAGTWIVRNIPTDLMRRTRMAAFVERKKTVRQLLMDLVEGHLSEMERRGLLPKGK